jgi:hypothetical protein
MLAEAVGEGLHSLAQPLTAALWNLELMSEAPRPNTPAEIAQTLSSIEQAVAKLDMVRDLIRPFRSATVFSPASLKQAVTGAWITRREALENEGVRLTISEACASGEIVVPEAFLERMTGLLMELLRALAPCSAFLEISESNEAVSLCVTLSDVRMKNLHLSQAPNASSFRGYVKVLGGTFVTAEDDRWLRIELPKRQ